MLVLADRIRGTQRDLGRSILVGISGVDCAGTSTLAGRRAILVGFPKTQASSFCRRYIVIARRGLPIARCVLNATLAAAWPWIFTATGS